MYIFNSVMYHERMRQKGAQIPVELMQLLTNINGRQVETVYDNDGEPLDYGFVRIMPDFLFKVEMIDCQYLYDPISEYGKGELVLSKERENIRVAFVDRNEGYGGEYVPCDPADEKLLHLNVEMRNTYTGEYMPQGSVCTNICVYAPTPIIEKALNVILDCVCEESLNPNGWMKRRIESFSDIDENNISDYEKEVAVARVRRIAYERYQMYWLMERGATIDVFNQMAEGWLRKCNVEKKAQSFKEYIYEYGFFLSVLFPSFSEFLGNVYRIPELMLNILPHHETVNYVRSLGVKIYEYSDSETEEERNLRLGHTKYWCNSCGELHRYGKEMIAESELPSELRRAYHVLWADCYGVPCYLVEMGEENYGVALVNEYPANGKKAFDTAMIDAAHLAIRLSNAKITLAENAGCDESHELVICFPADISPNEMDAAVKEVNDILDAK